MDSGSAAEPLATHLRVTRSNPPASSGRRSCNGSGPSSVPRRKATGRRACSGMELFGLIGISLLDGEVADLAEQERTEQREQS